MRTYLAVGLSLALLSCSRGSSPSAGGSSAPAAPVAPVRAGGSMEIAIREFDADAPRTTTMAIGFAYALVARGRLALVLFNDQATGTSCDSLMRFGGSVSGTGWSLLIDNGEAAYDGRPGAIPRARININYPRDGQGAMRMMDGPITIREVTPGGVTGEIDATSQSGAIRVHGTFVAQRCQG